jgi:phosphatidate cytidylyltransferase
VIKFDQRDGASDLMPRVASAVVLVPLVLACSYAGGWIFLALCVIAAGGILWEWTRLVTGDADLGILASGWAALLTAGVLVGFDRPETALGIIAVGAIIAAVAVATRARTPRQPRASAWAAGGVVYAAAAFLGPSFLRRDSLWGLTALLFLFATVWVNDIFALFCGRMFGGPLLWPRVSPKKTWSGAVGGLIGGVAAGVGVAYASGIGKLGIIGVMGLLLSVLAQAGDLFESAIKRRFGAKNTSGLIPGHGGLMDRLDGFLVAAAAALIIGVIRQGTGAPARGLLVW